MQKKVFFVQSFAEHHQTWMNNHAGKDLPLQERLLTFKNNSCGVAFVAVFNRDQTECKH